MELRALRMGILTFSVTDIRSLPGHVALGMDGGRLRVLRVAPPPRDIHPPRAMAGGLH